MTEGESEDGTRSERPSDDPVAGDDGWLAETDEEAEARRRRQHERREERRRKVRRRRRRRQIAIVSGVALATLLVLGVVWFWWTFGGLERIPDSVGQAGTESPGTTILLVGSDPSRADTAARPGQAGWRQDLERSELVMLLHLTASRRALFVVSIPANSVVDIPGIGQGKLADAARAGGPRLVARTVEELTGVRLDRMAVLDLNAFREITDVLDGAVIDVPREACGLPPGKRRFDGQAALDYIALQPCMPRKDLDRVERQQSLVKALMAGALDGGKITHPLAVNRMLRATASHLALEKDFSYRAMVGMLWSMRHLRTGNTTFLTVPVAAKPLASQDGVDYVLLDKARDEELWAALRDDQVGQYLALHTDAAVLGR